MTERFSREAIDTLLNACTDTAYSSSQWVYILHQLLADNDKLVTVVKRLRNRLRSDDVFYSDNEFNKIINDMLREVDC